MDTTIISENTVAGKANPRHRSSDSLTPLRPEREGLINPTAYLRWREHVIGLEMHDEVTK